MFLSFRSSQLAMRIGVGIVFVWLAMGALIQPASWAEMWLLPVLAPWTTLFGILLMLTAVGLVTGFFLRAFAIAGIAFLVMVFVTRGINDGSIACVAIIGCLVALIIWPQRTYSS